MTTRAIIKHPATKTALTLSSIAAAIIGWTANVDSQLADNRADLRSLSRELANNRTILDRLDTRTFDIQGRIATIEGRLTAQPAAKERNANAQLPLAPPPLAQLPPATAP
jgi:ABC-type transporter Mla subunit MlaD